MLDLIIYLELSFIAVRDVQTLKISNRSLVLLLITFLAKGSPSSSLKVTFSVLGLAVVLALLKVGMGDIKLLSILTYFSSSLIFSFKYLCALSVVSLLTLILVKISGEESRIPFAPALAIPFIALNLAI